MTLTEVLELTISFTGRGDVVGGFGIGILIGKENYCWAVFISLPEHFELERVFERSSSK
jgi:hypothetical protein